MFPDEIIKALYLGCTFALSDLYADVDLLIPLRYTPSAPPRRHMPARKASGLMRSREICPCHRPSVENTKTRQAFR